MGNLELEDLHTNPSLWIHKLHNMNTALGAIDTAYKKADIIMVSHILHKLPKVTYQQFMEHHELQGYTAMTLKEFKNKVATYWWSSIKSKEDMIQYAMNVTATSARTESTQTSIPCSFDQQATNLANEVIKKFEAMMSQKLSYGQGGFPRCSNIPFCSNCNCRGHSR